MENQNDSMELTLSDIIRIFRKRIGLFLLVVIATIVFTILYLLTATPVFEAVATLKVEPSSENPAADIFSSTYGFGGKANISTEVELIKRRINLEKVVKSLNLIKKLGLEKEEIAMDIAVNTLDKWITVSPVKDTKLVEIAVQHPDPILAAQIANKLAEVYNELLKSLSKNQYTVKREFIEEQIPKIEKELKDVEERIRKFKEENGVFVLDEEAKWLLEMMSQYDTQLNEINIQIEETRAKIKAIKELLAKTEEKIITSETISMNPVVMELKQKLTDLNVRLSGLMATRPESDAEVIALKKQISETKNLIKKEVEKIVTSQIQTINPVYSNMVEELAGQEASLQVLLATRNAVEKLRDRYQTKLARLPRLEQILLEMQRELKVKESLYTLLLEKLEETRIAEAGVIGNAQIVERAAVPKLPVKPNKKLTLAIGGVLGIFLGILIVFMAEYLDKTIKEEMEVQQLLRDIPVLGRIPRMSEIKDNASELVVTDDPTSVGAESFKLVVTNLQFAGDKNVDVVAVTSTGPGEGKTLVAANVAATFAQNGFKTLIIDLDMRKPRVEKVFGISKRAKMGVVNHFVKNVPLEEVTINLMENLDIIPVGPLPPNPTVILTNPRFPEIIAQLRKNYDKVVVDLPPVLAAADALIVGKYVDGLIIVVRMSQTLKPSLRTAYDNIRTSGNKLLGVVLNDISEKSSQYYYYYYSADGKRKRRFKTSLFGGTQGNPGKSQKV